MKVFADIRKDQIFIIPTFGWINQKWYYGYPVFCITFAWLCFRFSLKFGLKKAVTDNA